MKNKNIYLIIGIIILIGAIVGITYAYWQLTLQQTNTNVVTTDCFNITFTDSNDINLQKAYPITNSEGASLTPYTFTIENTCDGPATYQINLETMSQEASVKVLPEQYLKANLIELDSTNASTNNLISDYEVTPTIANALRAYRLDTGILQGSESKTFELRLWLDYDTPAIDEVMNATYNGKISIISTYREAPSNMIMASAFNNSSFSQHRSNIQTLTFEDTLSPKENATYTYDISANQDGSVMVYLLASETSGLYDMYIQSNGKVYANYDSSSLFYNFGNLIEINNLQNLDTSYTIDMSYMFSFMDVLTELDLSSFDTSNVTDMSYMFSSMDALTELDLSSFDTSNVTNMSSMFYYAYGLNTITYGNKFVYANSASVSNMFNNCPANKPTDSSWDGVL